MGGTILDRIKAIEDRLNLIELENTTFEFSRDKHNAHNIVKEISHIKDEIGMMDTTKQTRTGTYWINLNKV